MRIILDFDRVLFDTDAFVAKLDELGIDHSVRNRALIDAALEQGVSFASFVREGVVDFLKERGQEVVIVSSHFSRTSDDNNNPEANPLEWQEMKIQLSGLAELVEKVMVTARDKREAFEEIAAQAGEVMVLDDEPEHIAVARELGFLAFQFKTKKYSAHSPEGSSRFEVGETVSSFPEFVAIIESKGFEKR